jgi:hypothetical protein
MASVSSLLGIRADTISVVDRIDKSTVDYIEPVGLTPAQSAERIEWAHRDGSNISWRTAAALLAQYPVIAGLCSLLPPLGIAAPVGGACITASLMLMWPSVLYEIGFHVGLARWDQAHGYQRV